MECLKNATGMRVRERLANGRVRGNDSEDGSGGFEPTHDLVANTHLLAAAKENRQSTTTHSGGYRLSSGILTTFVTT